MIAEDASRQSSWPAFEKRILGILEISAMTVTIVQRILQLPRIASNAGGRIRPGALRNVRSLRVIN
jgi:hypothetical protein